MAGRKATRGGKREREEMKNLREAKADFFRNIGAEVDKYGNVTLYHNTLTENVEKINKEGFKPTDAPINGSGKEENIIGNRVFFGHDKEWVSKTWSGGESDSTTVIKVKIPAEYLHQAGENRSEIFVEGTIKKVKGDIWKPNREPTSTSWDRVVVKRYFRKKQKG